MLFLSAAWTANEENSPRKSPMKRTVKTEITSGILTPKQKMVLDFIESHLEEHGFAPSQMEIAKNFGFKSLGTVQNYLVRLERQGFLRKSAWNARRGMQPVRAEALVQAVPLPLVGRVAAGSPIEAISTHETIEVPASMVGRGEHFVLRVKGSSMIDEGILDGDFVVIRKKAEAHNGETVVALIGNEATIKKFYRRNGNVELHPANPAYHPLIIESMVDSEFRIEGVLVGVIRRFD